MKLAIIVRKDLCMRTGKVAGQVGHASIAAYRITDSDKRERWYDEGQKKIILKVANEIALKNIADDAIANKLLVREIRDFGLTQLEPNTLTCISIGPDEDEKVNRVIKDLPLF